MRDDGAVVLYHRDMPTRLVLVRHGASELSEGDRYCGRTDAPLSRAGAEQAERTAQHLATERIAACYASPLQRARRTAEIVAAAHKLPIIPEPDLREIDHGHWEGLHQEEVKTRFAAEYGAWSADPLTYAPPGGETGLGVVSRALPALRRIMEEHQNQNILVVSHKATIRLCAAALIGLDPRRYRDRFTLGAGSLSIISFETFDRPRLELWNYAP